MQCTAHKRKPTTPWGYRGRFRCPNPATARVTALSSAGRQVGKFVVCDDHQESGAVGMQTPSGWSWTVEPLGVAP